MQETIIYGRRATLLEFAKENEIAIVVTAFEGGYDDYDGQMGWAIAPISVTGQKSRFCANPGRWMSGIRISHY